MDWKFAATLAVNVIGIGFMYWQVQIMKQQISALPSSRSAQRIERERKFVKRLYIPVVLMIVLILASWIPYFVGTAHEIPEGPILYMPLFGPNQPFEPSNPILRVDAEGRLLLSRKQDYRLAAVAFRYYGNGDMKDSPNLQKSGLYDIENRMVTIFIHPDRQFIQTMQNEARTFYYLLLVPNRVQIDQFATLRQAESLGVIIISSGMGPP
jgi:hypothetical protein